MAKCNYKNSLRGCSGDGVVCAHAIVHYNLREYDALDLCEGCILQLMVDVLKDLERERNKELSLYVFDLEYNLRGTVYKEEK